MVCAFVYKNCWGGQTALERAKEQLRKGAPEWMPSFVAGGQLRLFYWL